MKSLIAAALMMVSFSTFSTETSSVDTLLSVLPLGTHKGMDDLKTECTVSVNEVNFPAKVISVTIENENGKIFKIVNDGSEFVFRGYKKEFIQTDRQYVDASRNSYVERVIRTVSAGADRLFVVVANELTIDRELSVESIECVVNL